MKLQFQPLSPFIAWLLLPHLFACNLPQISQRLLSHPTHETCPPIAVVGGRDFTLAQKCNHRIMTVVFYVGQGLFDTGWNVLGPRATWHQAMLCMCAQNRRTRAKVAKRGPQWANKWWKWAGRGQNKPQGAKTARKRQDINKSRGMSGKVGGPFLPSVSSVSEVRLNSSPDWANIPWSGRQLFYLVFGWEDFCGDYSNWERGTFCFRKLPPPWDIEDTKTASVEVDMIDRGKAVVNFQMTKNRQDNISTLSPPTNSTASLESACQGSDRKTSRKHPRNTHKYLHENDFDNTAFLWFLWTPPTTHKMSDQYPCPS